MVCKFLNGKSKKESAPQHYLERIESSVELWKPDTDTASHTPGKDH